jgi:hypothetical protein
MLAIDAVVGIVVLVPLYLVMRVVGVASKEANNEIKEIKKIIKGDVK